MDTEVRLLRLPEVVRRTGLSRSELYRRIRAGTFCPIVKLGARASAFDERGVNEWIAERIASSGSQGDSK
jgi:prophage regulatory protein